MTWGSPNRTRMIGSAAWILLTVLVGGCRTEDVFVPLDFSLNRMIDQPRYEPYRRNDFFDDRRAMRPPPVGTIRHDRPYRPPAYTRGRNEAGAFVSEIPVPVTEELVGLGERSFRRTCAACHGTLGDGDSVPAEHMLAVVPPDLHEPRLRAIPDGQLFATITEGYGLMPSYIGQLDTDERWAVVAYVRALQFSQHAAADTLPAALRERLDQEEP